MTPHQRLIETRAIRLAYANGALWAFGNGLVSTSLVIYLAGEFGAKRIAIGISLILAAPHLVGFLRLSAPAIVARVASRKQFTIWMFAASSATLLGLPAIAAPGVLPSAHASLAALVVLWSVFHLFQYLATVALWSWLGDVAPASTRGSFLGRRNLWMVATSIAAMLASGWFVANWRQTHVETEHWIGYAISAAAGALVMFAALVPLARMPALESNETVRHTSSSAGLFRALADPRFRRLLWFGCWFSFFNGITQSAQFQYFWLLGISLFQLQVLRCGTRAGQVAISPALGSFADRFGNRPLLISCQWLVALGPLFYFLATPAQPWWIVGAWIVWIAYAGINIGLPNLMLKLSPCESAENIPYIAVFYAITGLFYAANTVFGGWLADQFGDSQFIVAGVFYLDFYDAIFLTGWLGRTAGVLLLFAIIEPGAQRWRSILSSK